MSDLSHIPEEDISCDEKGSATFGLKAHPSLLVPLSDNYHLVIVEANTKINRT